MDTVERENKINRLLALREQVLGSVTPLLDSVELEPGEKFDLYSQLAQTRGDYELYEKAFKAAQEMQTETDKLRAYLDLLGSVDIQIQDMSSVEELSEQPQPQESHETAQT